jgi:hypothetical protein
MSLGGRVAGAALAVGMAFPACSGTGETTQLQPCTPVTVGPEVHIGEVAQMHGVDLSQFTFDDPTLTLRSGGRTLSFTAAKEIAGNRLYTSKSIEQELENIKSLCGPQSLKFDFGMGPVTIGFDVFESTFDQHVIIFGDEKDVESLTQPNNTGSSMFTSLLDRDHNGLPENVLSLLGANGIQEVFNPNVDTSSSLRSRMICDLFGIKLTDKTVNNISELQRKYGVDSVPPPELLYYLVYESLCSGFDWAIQAKNAGLTFEEYIDFATLQFSVGAAEEGIIAPLLTLGGPAYSALRT